MNTPKSTLYLLVFVALGVCWALVVTVYAQGVALAEYNIPAPYAGMALGVLAGWLVIALGLRVYCGILHKNAVRWARSRPPIPVTSGKDPLVPCQTMYRQPYINWREMRSH